MKFPPPRKISNRGSSLLEAVIAVGVLAVAIPLVFGTIAETGKSGISAEAETRSTWMVPTCLAEIDASRDGKPQYFTPTTAGQAFPAAGEVWALAFSAEGAPIGKVDKALYDKGVRELNGQEARYLVALSSESVIPKSGEIAMMRVLVSVEYPSTAPATKRQKLDFFSRIP